MSTADGSSLLQIPTPLGEPFGRVLLREVACRAAWCEEASLPRDFCCKTLWLHVLTCDLLSAEGKDCVRQALATHAEDAEMPRTLLVTQLKAQRDRRVRACLTTHPSGVW